MGELRTLKRASSGGRRGEQGRLSIVVEEEVPSRAAGRVSAGGRADGFRRPTRKTAPRPEPHPADALNPAVADSASAHGSVAYRQAVAAWSIEDRLHWGRLADRLEDDGLSWREAEIQAYLEIWRRLQFRGPDFPAEPAVSPTAPGFAD